MKRSIIIILLLLVGCSLGNVNDVKQHAAEVWKQNGFEIVGYQGYALGQGGCACSYGGAQVWYRLKNIPDNGIIYEGSLQRWGNEYHVYNLKAVDAIKP